jgi:hypothetical protein
LQSRWRVLSDLSELRTFMVGRPEAIKNKRAAGRTCGGAVHVEIREDQVNR